MTRTTKSSSTTRRYRINNAYITVTNWLRIRKLIFQKLYEIGLKINKIDFLNLCLSFSIIFSIQLWNCFLNSSTTNNSLSRAAPQPSQNNDISSPLIQVHIYLILNSFFFFILKIKNRNFINHLFHIFQCNDDGNKCLKLRFDVASYSPEEIIGKLSAFKSKKQHFCLMLRFLFLVS